MIVIEDDDGFKTEWPENDIGSMLHNPQYIALCEALHDAARKEHDEKQDQGGR